MTILSSFPCHSNYVIFETKKGGRIQKSYATYSTRCMGFFSKGGMKMDNCVTKCKINRSWIRFVLLYIMYEINAIMPILLKVKVHLTANKQKHTTLSFCWSSMRYYNEGFESTAKAMEKLDCWKHLHDYSSPLFLSANKLQQIFQSYVWQICAGLWVCL